MLIPLLILTAILTATGTAAFQAIQYSKVVSRLKREHRQELDEVRADVIGSIDEVRRAKQQPIHLPPMTHVAQEREIYLTDWETSHFLLSGMSRLEEQAIKLRDAVAGQIAQQLQVFVLPATRYGGIRLVCGTYFRRPQLIPYEQRGFSTLHEFRDDLTERALTFDAAPSELTEADRMRALIDRLLPHIPKPTPEPAQA